MSLQGSLDGFPLPDVLALLASTKKQGELRVVGHHGTGRVWLHDGAVVGVEAGDVRAPVDALFQLLRVDTGTFTFDPSADPPDAKPTELEPLLAEAQARLAEWRVIEATVPSLAASVELADELPAPKVTVSATQWRVLRTVAGGAVVGDVARVLGTDEFGACQAVKRLADAGLVLVGGERSSARAEGELQSAAAEEEVEAEVAAEAEAVVEPDGAPDPDELVTIPAHLRRARRLAPAPEPVARRRNPMAEAAARRRRELGEDEGGDLVSAAAAALTPENADALVRELSDLGTDLGTNVDEAAEAIEAASHASTPEERAAALEGVLSNEQGEPLNRSMLLKFLSSVRS